MNAASHLQVFTGDFYMVDRFMDGSSIRGGDLEFILIVEISSRLKSRLMGVRSISGQNL